jgi:hypothetical protein
VGAVHSRHELQLVSEDGYCTEEADFTSDSDTSIIEDVPGQPLYGAHVAPGDLSDVRSALNEWFTVYDRYVSRKERLSFLQRERITFITHLAQV